MTDLELRMLTADDTAGIEARYEVQAACARADLPYDPPVSRREVTAQLAFPWEHHRAEHWIASHQGDVVGEVSLWFPQLDNTENVAIELSVVPARRRQGIGRQLAAHGIERARAAGRLRLVGEVCADGPPPRSGSRGGPGFAAALGATEALVEVRRRLDLETIDATAYAALLAGAEAASAAYAIVRWQSRMPDDLIDGIATLESRMVIDAPMGDLAWEQEQHDAARMRAAERVETGRGQRTFGSAAVHTASGTVAGFTTCVLDEDVPQHAWQGSTIVLPEHRGHRLGLRLKADHTAFVKAENPELRTIDTWNAAENEHMIKVNELLGYRAVDTWAEWQLELTP